MIHYEILDEARKSVLPYLGPIKDMGFYLAGGTALALQFGHRDSVDFDFFIDKDFNTDDLYKNLTSILKDFKIERGHEDENTLYIEINNSIKCSFITYRYPLIGQLIDAETMNLASIEDIGCMKLTTIFARAKLRDYIDIYYILQKTSLENLLNLVSIKIPDVKTALILRSLVYTDDLEADEIQFKNGFKLDIKDAQKYFVKASREYLNNKAKQ